MMQLVPLISTDNSAAVISATDSVLTDGNIHVDVTGTVVASDGAILNAFTADIDFDVADTAENIAAEVNYTPAAIIAVSTTACYCNHRHENGNW